MPEVREQAQVLLEKPLTEREYLCLLSHKFSDAPASFLESLQDSIQLDDFDSRLLDIAKSKKRISVVFASPIIHSPISSFGHLFLVFHDIPIPEEQAIVLDFTADSEVDLAIAVRSLTSGTPGRFRLRWFHQKRLEYDSEGRDLWVHEVDPIRLNQGLVERLLDSASARNRKPSLDYRFLNGNCSARILELLLEIDSPRQTYAPRVAAPLDDLQYLFRAGWIRSGNRTPSLISRAADSEEPIRSLLQRLVVSGKSPDPDLVHGSRDEILGGLRDLRQLRALPHARPDFDRATPPLNMTWGEDFRVGYAGQWNASHSSGGGITFEYRRGALDWVRADTSLFSGSELRYLSASAQISPAGIGITHLGLVRLDSFEPSTFLQNGLTRFVDFGFQSDVVQFSDIRLSENLLLQLGSGKTWQVLSSPKMLYGVTPFLAAGVGVRPGEGIEGKGDLGIRQTLSLNTGRLPRLRLLWDWRPYRWNGYWNSLFEASLVPFERYGVASVFNLTSLDGRNFRAELQVSLPVGP